MNDDKSRSQKKRESTALQVLGQQLSALSPSALRGLDLPPDLEAALVEWHATKTHEAKRRQMQYVGRLMRELDDPNAMLEAIAAKGQDQELATEHQHHLEELREKLVSPDDDARETALRAALAEYPTLNEPKLAHLIETALAERRKKKPPKAFREMFRYLRQEIHP